MIYFLTYKQKYTIESNYVTKRIHTNHALDFYQMWFGNEQGLDMFLRGTHVGMPNDYRFELHGEEISESGWFNKILQGKIENGYVKINALLEAYTT